MAIFAAPVLAGAYGGFRRGRSVPCDQTMLWHAVSDEPIQVGRLARGPAEAFCNRKLSEANGSLADECTWEGVSRVSCPRCRRILGLP